MESKTISRFPLKSNQQRLEFVNPGEGSLTHKATLVHDDVEVSFPSALHGLSIALILRNVGLDPSIPQQLPRRPRIEAPIRIEDGSFVCQSTSLHVSKDILQLVHKLISIIMVTSNDDRRRENVAIPIRHR